MLVLEPASTDRRLLEALEFVRANATRTSEFIGDEYTADVSFAPEARQKVTIDKRRPGKLVRRHFEICVFSCLADELVRGDVAAVGSEARGSTSDPSERPR